MTQNAVCKSLQGKDFWPGQTIYTSAKITTQQPAVEIYGLIPAHTNDYGEYV